MDIMNSFSVLDADGTGHTEDTSSPISTDSPSILEPNAGNDLAAKFYDAFNDIANEMSIINGKLKKVKSAEMTRQIVMAIERHGRDPNKDTATADGDGLPMTKLCNFLDKEKTSVSRWVRAAKKSGHVQEQRKSSDRRQKLLSLTESGWELFESLARTIADKIEPVLRHLSPKVNCEIFLENLEEFVVAFRAARLDIQENSTTPLETPAQTPSNTVYTSSASPDTDAIAPAESQQSICLAHAEMLFAALPDQYFFCGELKLCRFKNQYSNIPTSPVGWVFPPPISDIWNLADEMHVRCDNIWAVVNRDENSTIVSLISTDRAALCSQLKSFTTFSDGFDLGITIGGWTLLEPIGYSRLYNAELVVLWLYSSTTPNPLPISYTRID